MEVKAVVFDAGETLINESRQWRMWAEWLGVPDHAFFAVLGAVIERGEHHRRVFEILKPGFNLEEEREKRRQAGVPDESDARDLYPDALECLTRLRARGLRTGVAANQPAGFEDRIRELELPVDLIASSSRWAVEKPSPEFFRRIADELQLPAGAVAYVGDRLDNDVLPALDAGMVEMFEVSIDG